MDVAEAHKSSLMIKYLPTKPLPSEIITFDQLVILWMFLPEVIRIRIPEILFKASDHGFNIRNLYRKCEEFEDGYEHVILLIETTDKAIFGAYIDVMPKVNVKRF